MGIKNDNRRQRGAGGVGFSGGSADSSGPKSIAKLLPESQELSVPVFPAYITPNGYLDTQPETHALFFYYLNARRVYETYVKDSPIVMEGDPDPEYNFQNLFVSTAMLYAVYPENMANAWPQIDKQCLHLGLPLLPDEQRYRFNSTANISTH